jgi:hypothetical protein
MTIVSIPIANATNAQLRYFAETVLGLDVPKINNTSQLRSKIEAAMPNIVDVRAPDGLHGDAASAPEPKVLGGGTLKNDSIPDGALGRHQRFDPKVTLQVMPSSDKLRAKDVQIAVNGDVVMLQRGQKVAIPYRYYLALVDAVEMVAVELDEIDPQTSIPAKEWQEQHSYPFSVIDLPSPEAIAAWHIRMDGAEL